MDNVRRKHLSFRKARIKMLVSDQVADFYSDRKSIKTDKTIF